MQPHVEFIVERMINEGLDVSILLAHEYSHGQAYELYLGVRCGSDTSLYSDPSLSPRRMRLRRECIRYGVTMDIEAHMLEKEIVEFVSFIGSGMSMEEAAERVGVSIDWVRSRYEVGRGYRDL